MEPTDLIAAGLRLGALLVEVAVRASAAGDVSTLEALRAVVPDGDGLRDLDRLLVAAQRAKAARELPLK
jgi:hypothetical protein